MTDEPFDDGGPAFPGMSFETHGGMSLLDYFAAHSPITVENIADARGMSMHLCLRDADRAETLLLLAQFNHEYAAAMIAERRRRMGG